MYTDCRRRSTESSSKSQPAWTCIWDIYLNKDPAFGCIGGKGYPLKSPGTKGVLTGHSATGRAWPGLINSKDLDEHLRVQEYDFLAHICPSQMKYPCCLATDSLKVKLRLLMTSPCPLKLLLLTTRARSYLATD
jgi:hypothetical protein